MNLDDDELRATKSVRRAYDTVYTEMCRYMDLYNKAEEIIKQYANGIVDIDKLVGSLIDKFKIDKASVDIQQLQLVTEYLIYKVDKLQKENEELHKQVDIEFVEENYIEKSKVVSKNKIIGKIKELEEKDKASSTNIYGYGIKFLKELLVGDIE